MLFKRVIIHVVTDKNAQIHFQVWLWFGVCTCISAVCEMDGWLLKCKCERGIHSTFYCVQSITTIKETGSARPVIIWKWFLCCM